MYATFTNATQLTRISLMQSFVWWIRRRAGRVFSIGHGMIVVSVWLSCVPSVDQRLFRQSSAIHRRLWYLLRVRIFQKWDVGKAKFRVFGVHTKIRAMFV